MSGGIPKERERDWRWLIAAFVCGYLAVVLVVPFASGISSRTILQGFGVAALEHPFMDMKGVAAWCDAWASGHDPSIEKTWISIPGESSQPDFLMNYSPVVLGLGKIGLTQHTATGWAVVSGLIFVVALWFLCGSCSLPQALIWTLLICSPASVLVVERGNLDELLFALMVMALLLRRFPFAESGVILAASLIKFFPIAALVACWKSSGKGRRTAVILASTIFFLFLLLLRSRLASIGGSLSGQFQSAFGCDVAIDLLAHHGVCGAGSLGRIHGLCQTIAALGFSASFVLGWRLPINANQQPVPERCRHAFFMTAPMMLGLFMLGNQMDYKWIFFFPMVPVALELWENASMDSIAAKAWMAGILCYSFWTFFSDEGSLRNAMLKQAVMWGVMLLTAFMAGRLWSRPSAQ